MNRKPEKPRNQRAKDPQPLDITARDIGVLKLLTRYRYLNSKYLTAFTPGSPTMFIYRLRKLFDHGLVNRVHPELRIGNRRSLPEIYEIAPKGIDVLRVAGQYDPLDSVNIRPGKTRKAEFYHDVYICDILASMELGVRQFPHLKFRTFYDILHRAPETTQAETFPLSVWIDKAKNKHITPDAMFGIEHPDGRTSYYMLEADRDTESKPIVRQKMRNYLTYYKDIYRHFGIKNFQVLLVTVNTRHMEDLLKEVPHPQMFLFKTLTSFGAVDRPPDPSPHVFTKAWRRKGLPDHLLTGDHDGRSSEDREVRGTEARA